MSFIQLRVYYGNTNGTTHTIFLWNTSTTITTTKRDSVYKIILQYP